MDGGKQSSVDDEELNNMIANLQGGGQAAAPPPTTNVQVTPPSPAADNPVAPPVDAAIAQPPVPVAPNLAPPPAAVPTAPPPATPPANSGLDHIKREALGELRPLVDKLNLPPEDKFDTLLLIIRSTDDASLLPAAHAAAKQIGDETRRAQALLDVIKEIDFFGQQAK